PEVRDGADHPGRPDRLGPERYRGAADRPGGSYAAALDGAGCSDRRRVDAAVCSPRHPLEESVSDRPHRQRSPGEAGVRAANACEGMDPGESLMTVGGVEIG